MFFIKQATKLKIVVLFQPCQLTNPFLGFLEISPINVIESKDIQRITSKSYRQSI